jgi:hypothetical protein
MTKLHAHTMLKPSASVYSRAFGDELVLLDFGLGEYFGLDPIGAESWRLLEQGRSLGEIAKEIEGRYVVAYEDALRDVTALVASMCERGLVTPC